MSEWITDRAPTEKDTDKSAIWMVWTTYNGEVIAWTYDGVTEGTPWMPISKPEPYVKPKRYKINQATIERWCVIDLRDRDFVAKYLPTREAAERVAAIYNEVMP